MASNITTTHVYKVNGRLIVANSPTEAMNIFNDYYKETYGLEEEVRSLVVVLDDNITCPSSSALTRRQKKVSKEELKAWIIKNVSNMSNDSLAESLYSFIYK